MYSNDLLFLNKIKLAYFNAEHVLYLGFFLEINYLAYFYVHERGEKIESSPLEI